MTTRDVLRIRDFRLLVTGLGLSWLGDAFSPIALSVAIVLSGGGAPELGVILASAVVARLVCSLAGGVWADRVTPHRIMVATDLVRTSTAGGMALAFALGDPPIVLLAALSAVTAGAGAFFYPAFISIRPLVVPHALRQSGNAAVSFLQSAAQVAGPVLAGVVVAQTGSVAGFAINCATFLWSAACVSRVRARAEVRSERGSFVAESREGLVEIKRHGWLVSGLAAAGLMHIAFGAFIVLMEITAVRELGGAQALGAISAAGGIGGLLGGLVAMRYQPRRLLLAAFVALALFPLLPLAFAWPGTLVAILLASVLGYGGLMFFSVGWDTSMQDRIPHDRLARVASWDILISFIALPVGHLLAGPLDAAFDTRVVMVGIAAWMLVAGCWPVLVTAVRSLTRDVSAPLDVAGEAPHPQPQPA